MTGHRLQRVNEQLKREIAQILVAEVKDPRVHGVTVTRVSAAPDLTLARVFVQMLSADDEREETAHGLRAATPFIRTLLGQRLSMRRVPELRFEEDRNLEHALRIEKLLDQVRVADPPDEPQVDTEGGTEQDGDDTG